MNAQLRNHLELTYGKDLLETLFTCLDEEEARKRERELKRERERTKFYRQIVQIKKQNCRRGHLFGFDKSTSCTGCGADFQELLESE